MDQQQGVATLDTPRSIVMTGIDWPNAQMAMRHGKKVRRELWVSWVYKDGGKMFFDLPENWKGGRVYWPTETDKAARDWECLA